MQKVSNAYKESMKSSLRERGYIMISFGLVNQEIQAKAKIDPRADFAYFSNSKNIFGERTELTTYATLEENFAKVDGSMFFLPRRNASSSYYDTGIVSNTLVSAGQWELTINLNVLPTDFKGITINFGDNYPVDFDMVGSSGQVIEFRDNDESEFTTEEVLENTTYVKLIFYRMKNPQSRVRIYSIRFGYGLVYYNDDVMASTLESYISPIGADVPQVDFSVQLKNYDKYFNVDNPKSAINFLETGQEMEIYYGYQLPDSEDIEWVRGNRLLCSEWESDDFTATIRCQDIFRNMDSEYYRGTYTAAGVSYYDLAVAVLADAGVTSGYYIDPRLKRLYTKNPLPRVKTKEALQIIANACRCVLSQTRKGAPQIKSAFVAPATISVNAEAPYSNINNVLNSGEKQEYATLATNYTPADGTMYFLPRNLTNENVLNTGFVSAVMSDANGRFTTNPVITLVQEAATMYYGAKFIFGSSLPAEFIVRTYNNGDLVQEITVNQDITKTYVLLDQLDDFDTMTIEFTRTAEPFNRITLNWFSFGDIAEFTMTRVDMTSSPKAIKQELIKEVIVPCYTYQTGAAEESLIGEEGEIVSGETETFYIGEPSYGYRVELENQSGGVEIVSSGSYYVTVRYSVTGTYRVNVYGHRYKIVERYATKTLNLRGKTIKWENPLISDMTMAADLAQWLGDYYSSNIEYEYNTRGNPEIDPNDIIYQENEFRDNMKVNVYRTTLNFNQSFSGKVTARRIGG